LFVYAEDLNAEIGATVRRLREDRRMVLRDLGLDPSQLMKLEAGRANWLPHHLTTVAQALGVHPRDLLPENPTPPLLDAERRLLEAVRARDWPRAMVVLGELATQPDKDVEP
jgi:transcriptional regulator with XRE-family HTH domain